MGKKVNITKEQYDRIKQVYETGEISICALAYELGIDRLVVKRGARELGVEKKQTINSHSGIKVIWTEEMISKLKEDYKNSLITVEDIAKDFGLAPCTIQTKAKEIGIVKARKTSWNVGKIEQLKELAADYTIMQLSDKLGICDEVIMKKVKELNLKYFKRPLQTAEERAHKNKLYKLAHKKENPNRVINRMYPSITVKGDNGRKVLKADFVLALGDTSLTSIDVAKQYEISDSTVRFWRQQLYGKVKLKINTHERITTAEKDVISLLDELDLAYIPHKKVEGKIVDIYLGNKSFIEVDGDYWHRGLKRKLRDFKIRKRYKDNGYRILVIKESSLKEPSKVKDRIRLFMTEDSLVSNDKSKTA